VPQTKITHNKTANETDLIMNTNLRVLVIAQYFPPDMGGGSTRASNGVKGLLSKGCDVTVVAAFPHYPQGNVPKKNRLLVSIEKARKILGYSPSMDFKEGLKQVNAWFIENWENIQASCKSEVPLT